MSTTSNRSLSLVYSTSVTSQIPLTASVILSGPRQNYHNGFLTNCPPLSLALSNSLIINWILTLPAYALQQLLITLTMKSKVPDTPSKALIYSYPTFPVFFHTTIPFSPPTAATLIFQLCILANLLPASGDTHSHLTASVPVRSQLRRHLLMEALPDTLAWVRSLCDVPVLESTYQHCNQLFLLSTCLISASS